MSGLFLQQPGGGMTQAAADALYLALAGGTMTGALVNSTNGAASTPALQLTGTPFTGGSATTTKPLALLETAGATSNNWSTSGTMLGVNAPSGFGGRLFDMQVNGSSRVQVSSTGGLELRPAGAANDFIGIGGTTNQLISFNQNALGVSLQIVGDNTGTGAGASVRFGATGYLSFQSTNRVDSGSADIGLARGSAGHLKVTDGSTGAGTLQFGIHSALAGETVTGYITIKDGGGTDRKVAIVS